MPSDDDIESYWEGLRPPPKRNLAKRVRESWDRLLQEWTPAEDQRAGGPRSFSTDDIQAQEGVIRIIQEELERDGQEPTASAVAAIHNRIRERLGGEPVLTDDQGAAIGYRGPPGVQGSWPVPLQGQGNQGAIGVQGPVGYQGIMPSRWDQAAAYAQANASRALAAMRDEDEEVIPVDELEETPSDELPGTQAEWARHGRIETIRQNLRRELGRDPNIWEFGQALGEAERAGEIGLLNEMMTAPWNNVEARELTHERPPEPEHNSLSRLSDALLALGFPPSGLNIESSLDGTTRLTISMYQRISIEFGPNVNSVTFTPRR